MPEARDLPKSELEIMGIVWQKGAATVRDVWTELNTRRKLNYKTVATLLMRLRERGYVAAEEKNFVWVFRPLVPREQVVNSKLDDLVNKTLGGDLTPLALYMAQHGDKLTPEQIETLEGIVKSAKTKGGK
jgi:BlaI family transcriptional regulator, penicillinase repressor